MEIIDIAAIPATQPAGGGYVLSEKLTLTFGIPGGRFAVSPRAGLHLSFTYDFFK